jgi:segregation and condensation protein A
VEPALAHREKLPETTAALSRFLLHWTPTAGGGAWVTFDGLVQAWAQAVETGGAGTAGEEDLDRDRVGVFWALLFLSAQGRVELEQAGGLYGPLRLRRLLEESADPVVLARLTGQGSDRGPARAPVAA